MSTKNIPIGTVTLPWQPEPCDHEPYAAVVEGRLRIAINGGIGPVVGSLGDDLTTLITLGMIHVTAKSSSGWSPRDVDDDADDDAEDDPSTAAPCSVTLAMTTTSAGASLVSSSSTYDSVQEAMRQIVRSAWRRANEDIRRPHVIAGLAREMSRLDSTQLDPGSRVLLASLHNLAQSRTPNIKASFHQFTMAKPVVSGHMTMVPLFGDFSSRKYDTLAEAVALGRATISELPHDAQVPRVQVTVTGKRAVLVHAGDVVNGLRQHRVFTASALITGTAILPVACVERGRWGNDQQVQGILRAPPRVRTALTSALSERQGRVWSEVDAHLRRHGRQNPTESLAQAETMSRHPAPPALPAQALGVLAFRHGRFIGMEIASHPEVLTAVWPHLWSGWAEDGETRPGAGIPATIDELFMALDQTDRPEAPGTAISLEIDGWSRDDDHLTGNAVVLDGRIMHASLLAAAD